MPLSLSLSLRGPFTRSSRVGLVSREPLPPECPHCVLSTLVGGGKDLCPWITLVVGTANWNSEELL